MRGQRYSIGRAITPSDTVNITHPLGRDLTDCLYVDVAGTVTVVWGDDTTSAFTAVAGEFLPLAVKRVNSTGTTATGLDALYNL